MLYSWVPCYTVCCTSASSCIVSPYRLVDGLDATAARTFGTIANQLHSLGIDLIITSVSKPSIRHLLVAHGAIPEVQTGYRLNTYDLCHALLVTCAHLERNNLQRKPYSNLV